MLLSLALVAAVSTTAPRPELITLEPTTTNARLLDAFQRAEDDFKSVQRELGLAGSAPLAGLKVDKAAARHAGSPPGKARVQKASLKTSR